ncbi:hypothetical protein MKX03_004059 [Papaver bracteatum]|nr:hypothetical protein MKX03_004059 [Papaver bracteatum]
MALRTGIRNISQKLFGSPSVKVDKRYGVVMQKLDVIQEEYLKKIGNRTDPEAMLVANECSKVFYMCGEIVDRFDTIEKQLAELEATKSQRHAAESTENFLGAFLCFGSVYMFGKRW